MDALQYAQDLIAIDSTSSRSNLAIADYLAARLDELGFQIERVEYEDEGGERKACLIARRGEGGGGGLAYFGHMDAVPAPAWLAEGRGPFSPVVIEGKLYGRGACDMKGSLACFLAAAERAGGGRRARPLYGVFTADEEIGYGGAKQVVARSRLFREISENECVGVIGEPTSLEVVHAHKGTYGFRAISHGVAAHSSSAEGRNANLAMIPFLVEMKRIHDETERDPAWRNDQFEPPTISWNICVNDGMTPVNVTAARSVCTVYFRPMPGQDAGGLMRRAEQAARRGGMEFEVFARGEPLYVDPHSTFVQESLRLAGKKRPRSVAYGTDACIFTSLKKLILIGPGDIAQAHTDCEWIALEQLERGAAIYRDFIEHWCG